MLSLNYENINYVMIQILKLNCASFSYVNISYVLASKYHSCEPFFAPELGGKFKLMNGTDKMLIFSYFCISKIDL